MSSDLEVFKAIVDAFERSDWAEIDVRSGSLRIHLSTHSQPVDDSSPAHPGEPSSRSTAKAPDGGSIAAGSDAVDLPKPPSIPVGAHVVSSPSPGIFWRSPQPGSPPFADIGDDVESGRTLCIVEVMKLMNHVSSGIGGTVVGVFAENGTRVDRGDALFAVQPSATP